MAAITFDKERVLAAIDAVVRQTMNMDMTWDWPCGVAYFGICEAYRATGKQEYLDWMKARVDEYIPAVRHRDSILLRSESDSIRTFAEVSESLGEHIKYFYISISHPILRYEVCDRSITPKMPAFGITFITVVSIVLRAYQQRFCRFP